MLGAKFAHVPVLGAMDAAAVRVPQRWPPRFQQLHRGSQGNLLVFRQAGPPVTKFVSVFNIPIHATNIASVEYSVSACFGLLNTLALNSWAESFRPTFSPDNAPFRTVLFQAIRPLSSLKHSS